MVSHRKWIYVWVATVASISSLAAANPSFPVVTNTAQLDAHLNEQFTNALLGKIMPPGIPYENHLGLLSYSAGFDTNDLAPMPGGLSYSNILIYAFSLTETNTPSRQRHYHNATGTVVRTLAPLTGYDPDTWIEATFGDPPAWLSGSALDDWYTERDPMRQTLTFSLISSNDVPAYIIALSNQTQATAGSTIPPPIQTYSNQIAFVAAQTTSNTTTLFLHAPEGCTQLDVYQTTNLINGPWSLPATLSYTAPSIPWTLPESPRPLFLDLGNPAIDGDQGIGDGLADSRELRLWGTDPTRVDSDGDGLSDFQELLNMGLDPTNPDSDGDGVPDNVEIDLLSQSDAFAGLSPTVSNSYGPLEIAAILKLPAIEVNLTAADFDELYLNQSDGLTNTPGTVTGVLTASGLVAVASNTTYLAPLSLGDSLYFANQYHQYTSLGLYTNTTPFLRVVMDHYDSEPDTPLTNASATVTLSGAKLLAVSAWINNEDSSEHTAESHSNTASNSSVTWSCDFDYTNHSDDGTNYYSNGGWGYRDLTFEPLLPTLSLSTNALRLPAGTTNAVISTVFSPEALQPADPVSIWWTISPAYSNGLRIAGVTNYPHQGSNTLTLIAGDLGESYTITAHPYGLSSIAATATVDIIKVDTVEWKTYSNVADTPTNLPLSTWENNDGKRIYAGAVSPDDTTSEQAHRRYANVEVKLSSPVAGQTIYYKIFDVDDPSASSAPVDDDSGVKGADNDGNGDALGVLKTGMTDASGTVVKLFVTSSRPGDNYRAYASCCQAAIQGLTQANVDEETLPANGLLRHVDGLA